MVERWNFFERQMYPYSSKVLKRRYPERLGWDIIKHQRPYNHNCIPDFLLERNQNGIIEKVVAEVKKADRVKNNDIKQIRRYASAMAGSKTKVINLILILPSGADIGNVPDDIEIIRLTSFKCEDDGIWWYR